jgi:hypothetical protein
LDGTPTERRARGNPAKWEIRAVWGGEADRGCGCLSGLAAAFRLGGTEIHQEGGVPGGTARWRATMTFGTHRVQAKRVPFAAMERLLLWWDELDDLAHGLRHLALAVFS